MSETPSGTPADIPYVLVRSTRRTLAIAIDDRARLVVRAPLRLPEKDIRAFIAKKTRWITDRQRLVQESTASRAKYSLEDGGSVLYFGDEYTIVRRDVKSVSVVGGCLVVPCSMTGDGFTRWLKMQARAFIRERVEHRARLMGVAYESVSLSSARRRWGSCGPKNTLNFAWRLVMCPPWVIDYVVVHELSHVTHKNHGPQFWASVAATIPNYKDAKKWLRVNQQLIDAISMG